MHLEKDTTHSRETPRDLHSQAANEKTNPVARYHIAQSMPATMGSPVPHQKGRPLRQDAAAGRDWFEHDALDLCWVCARFVVDLCCRFALVLLSVFVVLFCPTVDVPVDALWFCCPFLVILFFAYRLVVWIWLVVLFTRVCNTVEIC